MGVNGFGQLQNTILESPFFIATRCKVLGKRCKLGLYLPMLMQFCKLSLQWKKYGSIVQCYPETNRRTGIIYLENRVPFQEALYREIEVDGIAEITDFTSDHEETDTWLVVLAFAINLSTRNAIMVQSPSGEIGILALFFGT